jgi:prepilin-type N-terminal cleavage/methylation domain-containing protein
MKNLYSYSVSKANERGRLQPALPVEGAARAPIIRNQRGFTLIELLVVLVILGILTAIAVTRYQDLTTEAQIGATKGNLATIRGGINLLHARLILSGFTGATQWPTVAELNDNALSRPGSPVDLLRVIDGPAGATCVPASNCMPPNTVMANVRLVQGVTPAEADSRAVAPPAVGAGVGWFYDPLSGQLYVAATTPPDSMGMTANLW